jgi:hypothetical protein
MSRIAWVVCAALAAAPGGVRAEEPKPDEAKAAAKKGDAAERVLGALAQPLALPDGVNVSELPLGELLQVLAKRHAVNFVVNDNSFKAAGRENVRDEKPNLAATGLTGLTLHQFLVAALDPLEATYLVRNGAVEVVSVAHAAKVTKANAIQGESGPTRLTEPLVCAIVKEKPLNETVAKIAEMYDLTVVVAPQAADAKAGFVTARILNTPADKALELLALQADLRVVRRGTAYLITSRDHANELFNEKLDRERQKIEVEKLREAPVRPPAPPEPPKPEEKKP